MTGPVQLNAKMFILYYWAIYFMFVFLYFISYCCMVREGTCKYTFRWTVYTMCILYIRLTQLETCTVGDREIIQWCRRGLSFTVTELTNQVMTNNDLTNRAWTNEIDGSLIRWVGCVVLLGRGSFYYFSILVGPICLISEGLRDVDSIILFNSMFRGFIWGDWGGRYIAGIAPCDWT